MVLTGKTAATRAADMKVDLGRPRLKSPHGRGTLRYVECLRVGDVLHYFYEMARPDFAHELRTVKVPVG